MKKLNESIKTARKRRNLTQGELAKKAGLSQTTISDIERGRNEGSRDLHAIALALGMTVEDLVSGKETGNSAVKSHILALPKSTQIKVRSFAQIINNEQGTDAMIVFGELPESTYGYRLESDHMEGQPVFIQRGALLIINPDLQPVEGDIVLANVGGPTIGLFSRVGRKSMLVATRDKIPAVEVVQDQVLGVVLKWEVHYRSPARENH